MIPIFGYLSVKLYDLYNRRQKNIFLQQADIQKKTKNYTEAFKSFEQAANLRSSLGFSEMGFYYEHGLGVEKNKAEALKYYEQAADRHNMCASMKAIILQKADLSRPPSEEKINALKDNL